MAAVVKPGCAYARLTRDERVQIEALWKADHTVTEIARVLDRPISTISREIKRNGFMPYTAEQRHARAPRARWGLRSHERVYRKTYTAKEAAKRAREREHLKPRPAKFSDPRLCVLVASLLVARWSPQQVSGWLRTFHADRPDWQVSHEAIYQALFCQPRGELRREVERQVALAQAEGRIEDGPGDHRRVLRQGRVARRPQEKIAAGVRSRRAPKAWAADWHISTRPAEAEDRAVPGHWEGDLVIGKGGHSAIITLVERSTRYVLLGALPDGRRDSAAVIEVLSGLIGRLPEHLRRSLTWDNGVEMAEHATFRVATGCPVYFAAPHSPWQRGSNENTNGLLRQYFPKGVTDFRTVTQARLDQVAHELNGRPRMTLGWDCPARVLDRVVALAA